MLLFASTARAISAFGPSARQPQSLTLLCCLERTQDAPWENFIWAYNSAVDNGSTVALYYDANVWGKPDGVEIIEYPPGNAVKNCTEIPGTPQRCFE